MDPSALANIARRLLGLEAEEVITVEALPGGGNNQIYAVRASGKIHLMKRYFTHPGDPRDRGGTEFAFASFAWASGLRCIPEPLALDAAHAVGLFGFLPGRKCDPGTIGESEVAQAIEFLVGLNRSRSSAGAEALPVAAEACFSIREHCELVARRVHRLLEMEPLDAIDREAKDFVAHALSAAWREVQRILCARPDWETLLPGSDRILSPSDFGFHNALRMENGRLAFLDFEYAGWDDPAKLICDFFCHVAVPVPLRFLHGFSQSMGDLVADSDGLQARVQNLLPLYRVKWCCIVLNHFLPVDGARKRFAAPAASKSDQLEKARRLLAYAP